jgi:hypothetical protein
MPDRVQLPVDPPDEECPDCGRRVAYGYACLCELLEEQQIMESTMEGGV